MTLISEHREIIKSAAIRQGVSAQAIASIIFQEKLYGVAATLKDVPARIHAGISNSKTANKRSFGLAEMQVNRAAELLGLDVSKPLDRDKAISALDNDATSIDLIARNISDYQKKQGRPLTVQEAAVAHNSGRKGLDSFVKGEVKDTKGKVYSRSWGYQKEISEALGPPLMLPSHHTRSDQ